MGDLDDKFGKPCGSLGWRIESVSWLWIDDRMLTHFPCLWRRTFDEVICIDRFEGSDLELL